MLHGLIVVNIPDEHGYLVLLDLDFDELGVMHVQVTNGINDHKMLGWILAATIFCIAG
jgi:hypothetical protein